MNEYSMSKLAFGATTYVSRQLMLLYQQVSIARVRQMLYYFLIIPKVEGWKTTKIVWGKNVNEKEFANFPGLLLKSCA